MALLARWRKIGLQALERARAWLRLVASRKAELRFAFRVMVAGFLSFLLAGLLELPQGYWVMLTAVIVMQNNVGSSLKAATDRLTGTLVGAFGGFLATLIGANGMVAEGLVFALVLGPLAFLAASNPSFRIAPVTAIIVMLSRSGHEPALWLAVERVLEIILGGIIGVAVVLFVLPARAHADLAKRVAELLVLLTEAWEIEIARLTGEGDAASLNARLQTVNDRIRLKLVAAENAGDDTKRERVARLSDVADTDALLRTLRRLRHDFVLVGRATAMTWPAPVAERMKAPLKEVAEALETQMHALAAAARQGVTAPSADALIAAINRFGIVLNRLRSDPRIEPELIGGLFTLGFALEELRREVPELGNRLAEFAKLEAGAR